MNTQAFKDFLSDIPCAGEPDHPCSIALPAPALPAVEGADKLVADTVELPPEIICGVMHLGLKGILAGPSKSRKTWTLLDIAASVATGTKWMGFSTRKGRVLFVNLEVPRPFLRDRLQKLFRAKGLEPTGELRVWNLRARVKNLDVLVQAIVAEAKQTHYDLILIDPVYKLMAGLDENSAGDVSDLCNQLERICEETGAALLYASHFSKGNQAGKSAIDRISGSGVFGRDADSMMNFTAHAVEGCYTVEMILRNLPEQESFVVQWRYPVMVVREDLDPDDLQKRNKSGREVTLDEVLDLIPGAGQPPVNKKDLLKACLENGIGECRAKRLVKALLESNRMHKWRIPRRGTRPEVAYHRDPQLSAGGAQ